MSGRRRQALAPSLFPFLAVLVCTLGTLILLLALVAQNATSAAEQSARAAQQAADKNSQEPSPRGRRRLAAATVDSMIQEEQFRVEHLVAVRDQQTADVEVRRDQLTHLEDHVTRLQEQLRQLSAEARRASGETPTNIVDVSALEQLESEIDKEQAAVADLRAEAADREPRIVIVPHQGPNGTSRRPIYLECTAEGVTIWPEGSQISTLQLADAVASANPLDGALRAIRYHAMQNYGDSTPPYPLLVVRPDGIDSYAAARQAMRDWDDQFGYELVPADVKLAFPKADAMLKQRIDLAIREAAARQHVRHRMANEARGRFHDRLPTLSAASLDRQGRAGGFQSHRDKLSSPGRVSSPYGSRTPYSAGSPRLSGQWSSGGGGHVSGQDYAAGSSNYPGSPSATPSGTQSEAVRRLDDHLRTAAEELRQQDQAEGSSSTMLAGPATAFPSPTTSLPTGLGAAGDSSSDTGFGSPQSGLRNAGAFDSPQGSGLKHNAFAMPPTVPTTAANRGGASSTARSDSLAADQGSPPASQSDATDPGFGDGSQSQPDSESNPGSSSNAQSGGSGNESSGSDSAGRTGQAAAESLTTQPSSSDGAQSSPTGAMSQTPNVDQQPPGEAPRQVGSTLGGGQSLVKRQGTNWALPQSMAGMHGNKIVRTIRVQCYHDRFVLLPPGGGGATEMFGFSDGQVNRATLQLATAVRDRVERWGAAIPGGRWQPRLDVEVMPRGEARFHQLRTLMNGSGVEVEGRESR